tara:strand:+ start:137 stop:652 length:516 start_codon:yes stop_codon:yes gene_type:complete
MGQEFFINSQTLEDKIRQLLPSQGGTGAGFDLSASTQIIPIIDVTESAEGSNLREDLQKALSFANSTTVNTITVTTDTLTTTTGFWLLNVISSMGAANTINKIEINDGATDKILFQHRTNTGSVTGFVNTNLIVFMDAGDTLKQSIDNANNTLSTTFRQIATINGELVNPI